MSLKHTNIVIIYFYTSYRVFKNHYALWGNKIKKGFYIQLKMENLIVERR